MDDGQLQDSMNVQGGIPGMNDAPMGGMNFGGALGDPTQNAVPSFGNSNTFDFSSAAEPAAPAEPAGPIDDEMSRKMAELLGEPASGAPAQAPNFGSAPVASGVAPDFGGPLASSAPEPVAPDTTSVPGVDASTANLALAPEQSATTQAMSLEQPVAAQSAASEQPMFTQPVSPVQPVMPEQSTPAQPMTPEQPIAPQQEAMIPEQPVSAQPIAPEQPMFDQPISSAQPMAGQFGASPMQAMSSQPGSMPAQPMTSQPGMQPMPGQPNLMQPMMGQNQAVPAQKSPVLKLVLIVGIILVVIVSTLAVLVGTGVIGGSKQGGGVVAVEGGDDGDVVVSGDKQRVGANAQGFVTVSSDWKKITTSVSDSEIRYGDSDGKNTVSLESLSGNGSTLSMLANVELADAKNSGTEVQMTDKAFNDINMKVISYHDEENKEWGYRYVFLSGESVYVIRLVLDSNKSGLIDSVPTSWSTKQEF